MKAVILDGHLKSAVAATRSLGAANVPLMVGATTRTAPALHSRYATDTFIYVSPKVDQTGFVATLIGIAKDLPEKPVLLAFSDATYLTIARHRTDLEPYYQLFLPADDMVETAFSKAATYALARSLDIPTIAELSREAVVDFPVVVKPIHSVSWEMGSGAAGTAEIVVDKNQFDRTYDRFQTETGETPLIQEYIVGTEYGVEVIAAAGKIHQLFVHQRIRSLSPRGGASTVKATAPNDALDTIMIEHAQALVKALHWSGPMMVEFKADDRLGEVKLMEINGRFWGSLPLAIAAGVNFPLGYYALAAALENTPTVTAPALVRTQHFLGDCKWLLLVLFARDPLRHQLYPTRLQALGSFFATTLFVRGDMWSWRDPKPFIMEYIYTVSRLLQR